MKKQTKTTIGILLAFVFLLVVVALVWEFESPELGARTLAEVGERSGVRLQAKRFGLRLGRGLIGEDVEASSPFPGGRYHIHMDRMVLEHRLVPWFSGKLLIRRVLLERPRIDISLAGAGYKAPPPEPAQPRKATRAVEEPVPPSAGAREVAFVVSEIDLNEGVVSVEGPQIDRLALFIGGLHIGLQNPSLRPGALTLIHALTATGTLRAGSVVLEAAQARDVSATLRIERGRLDLGDLTLSTERGAFAGELAVDFNRIPVGYEMHLVGGPSGSQPSVGSGPGYGYVRVELHAQGFGMSTRNVKGEGLVKLGSGSLPSHPILIGIGRALPATTSLGSSYQPVEARFRIQDNRLVFEPFQLETDTATLDVSGAVHLEGELDLSFTVSFPGPTRPGSPSRGRLEAERIPARFHVTGTSREPHIERVDPEL